MFVRVLSQRALEGLRAYVYKPGGYTWLDDLHTPMWNWVTAQLPMWLAPNLITLSGLICTFVAYFLMWYFLPEFTGEAPRWSYFFAGVSIVTYTNLDCIDGKQARRTGSSSPLGQLFDHGCDAIALHVMLSLTQTALNEPSAVFTSIAAMSVYLPWIVSHWEEYHTGILMYGDGWFGILEANYVLAGITVVTGTFGPAIYEIPVKQLLPWWPWDISVKHTFIIFAMLIALVQFYGQMGRVFGRPWTMLPEAERGHKELGTGARLKHLAYGLTLVGLGTAYLADTNLQPWQARVAALLYGLVYATVATQLIMDHMSKEPFRPPLVPLAVLAAATANSFLQLADGRLVAFGGSAIMLVYYGIYVTSIVNQVCAFLGIHCLSITTKRA
uniref:Ethanolaminephosphotransferase n=1 Tax=Chlamydomonas sphaeroides TaxID=28458 RepID=A0A125SQH8_9CHLO|nr:ethanolaminephosphotransferase [Chlamydomonas sphaeroides]